MIRFLIHTRFWTDIANSENKLFRALEDGAVLGTLLGKIDSKSQIPAVTEVYDRIRRERISKIREETFRQQKEFHLADGELQIGRDRELVMSFDAQDGDSIW